MTPAKARTVTVPVAGSARNAAQALIESYAVNDRMYQIVLEHLDPAAWRARLPGIRGRTIADIVAHVLKNNRFRSRRHDRAPAPAPAHANTRRGCPPGQPNAP